MKELLKEHSNDLISLILRLNLGIVTFSEGTQRLFYLESDGEMIFTSHPIIPILLFSIQAVSSIALIAGVATRKVSALMALLMVFTYLSYYIHNAIYSNEASIAGNGLHLYILSIAVCIALLITGGGKWSVENIVNISFLGVKNKK